MNKFWGFFGPFKKMEEIDFNPGQATVWIEKKVEELKKRWAERKKLTTKTKRPLWDWEDCPATEAFSWLKDRIEDLFDITKKYFDKKKESFLEKHPKLKEKNLIFNVTVIVIGIISVPALWFITYLACI